MQRKDDYQERHTHLAQLSDSELEARFWQLVEQVVDPLVKLAETHTSPSIERSVLLRMGFSSLEANALVEKCVELGILGKGAGHVILVTAEHLGLGVRQAGEALLNGAHWDQVGAWLKGGVEGESTSR